MEVWKSSFFLIFITAIILSGCATSSQKGALQSGSSAAHPTSQSSATIAAVSADPSPSPEPSKKLTDNEQLAMDYISVYLNGSDLDATKKFVSEKIHSDVQSVFKLGESSATSEENKLLNPQVMQSVDFENGGKALTATLIKGDKNGSESEIIILTTDGKIAWAYTPSKDDSEAQKAFDDMKTRFK